MAKARTEQVQKRLAAFHKKAGKVLTENLNRATAPKKAPKKS